MYGGRECPGGGLWSCPDTDYAYSRGAVARLVRRVPCNQEGPGSSPVSSIYVLQQDILSALLLSTQVYKWVPGRNGMSAPMWLPCKP